MKKIWMALTTSMLALTAVASAVLSGQQTRAIANKEINWHEVKTNLTEDNMKNIFLHQTEPDDKEKEALNKAHKKSLEYIKYFETQKMNTLESVATYLKDNVKEFKENFKYDESKKGTPEDIIRLNKDVNLVTSNNSVQVSANKNLDQVQAVKDTEETINKLKILDTSLLSIAVIADIAAAGFWAAAWWFGISVPWAVAATSLAAALHVIQGVVHIFLVNNKTLEPKNWLSSLTWAKDITLFAISLSNGVIYNTAFLAAGAVVTATTWAVPAVLAGVGAFGVAYTWIKLYVDNII